MDFANAQVRNKIFGEWCANGEPEALRGKGGFTRSEWTFRALSTADVNKGETLVPDSFHGGLLVGMDATNVIRREATLISTKGGGPLQVPLFDDAETHAVMMPENNLAATADVGVADVTLGSFTLHSKIVRISRELFEDGGETLQRRLGILLGRRIGRTANGLFINGSGVSEPSGLLTTAPVAVTTASPSAITYENLVDLLHSMNSAYLPNAKWLMSPSTLAVVRKIVDDSSRPVFVDRLLLGHEVVLSEQMPQVGAEGKPIAFGDLRNFLVREIGEISVRRFGELYAPYGQVGLAAILRTDGVLGDTASVACLQMAEA